MSMEAEEQARTRHKPLHVEKEVIPKIREATQYQHLEELAQLIITNPPDSLDLTIKLEKFITDSECEFPIELKVNVFELMSAMMEADKRAIFARHLVTRIVEFLRRYSVYPLSYSEPSARTTLSQCGSSIASGNGRPPNYSPLNSKPD